jgi:hypothetical protein
MKISKTHKKFSDLEDPKVLTNPEDFLGPNWKDVINFWLHFDTLTKSEKEKIHDRYWALDVDVRESASRAAYYAAKEVVGWGVGLSAWGAAYYVTPYCVFRYATLELIAHHKLLEQNKTLIALPLCLKP